MAIAESMAVAQTDNTNVISENTKKLNDNTTSTFEKTEQDIFQNKLLDKFDNLNEILSCFLVIAIKDSSLKNMPTNDVKKIMPVINNLLTTINKNINV